MKTAIKGVTAGLAAALLWVSVAQAGGWYRHCYPRYSGHHHHDGWAIALGVTGAVIGTAIIADALTRPRYVAPAPTYYYAPPPPTYYAPRTYYQAPPVSYPSTGYAFTQGYRAGLAEARRYEEGRQRAWEESVDYGLGGRPYYGR
jgi:hypothetical protein